jgi:trans-2,3-dihydro-3-hydroxyanthranilate isomerase
VLIEAGSVAELNKLTPNHYQVAELTGAGVMVFAQEGAKAHARYFAPRAGINEDPATGSAAGPLGALLVLHERHPVGEELTVLQGHAMGRPSTLLVSVQLHEGQVSEVRVGGQAILIARGELLV